MGQILHGSAVTTQAIRKEIQESSLSIRALSKRYGINPKTVWKWKNRDYVHDNKTGPKNPRSTVLSRLEEAACVLFRQQTLLPLDDCLYALQESIPHLSRSSLYRLFKRHGINQLPKKRDNKREKKAFKSYPIGYFHIDIAEVRTQEGKLYLFVAIDRTSKFVYVELHERQTQSIATDFLSHLIAAVPYKITHVLTDNGLQFTHHDPSKHHFTHIFKQLCIENNIEHRRTRVKHPWTNGQVERMNRTIKDATVKQFHYCSHQQLKKHLNAFVNAYNFAKKLKALNGLTPYQFICNCWTSQPQHFIINPSLLNVKPYSCH